jgi:hypothetical protein
MIRRTFFAALRRGNTHGIMYRNYTPFFPLQYRISTSWKAELKLDYGKGFLKISEYDIFYNDGSGKNDQRAGQWGTGDFLGITLGIKYILKDR